MGELLQLTPALDGARVLYRHWRSTGPMKEGFVREFSGDCSLVRITDTASKSERGIWHRALELRVEAMLDPAKAPREEVKPEKAPRGFPPKESDFGGPELFQ